MSTQRWPLRCARVRKRSTAARASLGGHAVQVEVALVGEVAGAQAAHQAAVEPGDGALDELDAVGDVEGTSAGRRDRTARRAPRRPDRSRRAVPAPAAAAQRATRAAADSGRTSAISRWKRSPSSAAAGAGAGAVARSSGGGRRPPAARRARELAKRVVLESHRRCRRCRLAGCVAASHRLHAPRDFYGKAAGGATRAPERMSARRSRSAALGRPPCGCMRQPG